jgi:hypothetical protein
MLSGVVVCVKREWEGEMGKGGVVVCVREGERVIWQKNVR